MQSVKDRQAQNLLSHLKLADATAVLLQAQCAFPLQLPELVELFLTSWKIFTKKTCASSTDLFGGGIYLKTGLCLIFYEAKHMKDFH